MPTTWFYASSSSNKIHPVQVEKETANFVCIVGGPALRWRQAKTSDGYYYRRTFQEAKDALLAYYQVQLEREEARVEYCKKNITTIKSITQSI